MTRSAVKSFEAIRLIRRWAALSVISLLGLPITAIPEPQVARALNAMDFMFYEQAVSLFNEALGKNPDSTGVRVRQAYAYYRLNRIEKAEEVLNAELRVRPDDLASLVLLSFIQWKEGKWEDAEKSARAFHSAFEKIRNQSKRSKFEKILKGLFPNAGVPAYILGLKAKKNGEVKKARSWFLHAQSLGYDPVACWIRSIDAEIAGENFAEALRICRNGGDLSLNPQAPSVKNRAKPEKALPATGYTNIPPMKPAEIHFLEGFILDQMDKLDESLESLKIAIGMKPFDVGLVKNLAFAYYNRRDSDKTALLLRRVIKLDPVDVEARFLADQLQDGRPIPRTSPKIPLSRIFIEGRFEVRYRYVFTAAPDVIAARVNSYALNLIQYGLIRDAAGWLKAFLENYENSPTIYYNLGQIENNLGLRAEALEYAMKAVELKRDYREAYDLAANVLFKIGDFESSARFYEEVVRRDTKDPLSFYNLGCAYSESGDLGKAERNWLAALRLENALPAGGDATASRKKGELDFSVNVKVELISASACQSLGLLYVKQRKTGEALAFFLKAIELNPRAPQSYFESGKLFAEKGESAKAKEYFGKYLALGGDEAMVKEFLKK